MDFSTFELPCSSFPLSRVQGQTWGNPSDVAYGGELRQAALGVMLWRLGCASVEWTELHGDRRTSSLPLVANNGTTCIQLVANNGTPEAIDDHLVTARLFLGAAPGAFNPKPTTADHCEGVCIWGVIPALAMLWQCHRASIALLKRVNCV